MSKKPRELGPPKREEVREARKALREGDAKSAMTEHATAAKDLEKNRERLRAERLAREAVELPLPPKKTKG
jgi:hypothetical protein